ncbi:MULTISPECIES: hypothetical protein [unclassified Novosphingobium]|uniref:hypothetical protein n=1 Tax=unclassified Novosphingobium TaxID=2644732 RepID=UPI0025E2858F|nr:MULTISPECIES: hypothetical protein [unclassified Novosphingobium]HQV04688.1 hypothetical protein [Novosphingobium sp.]
MKVAHYAAVAGRNGPSLFAPPAAWAVAQFAGELIESGGRFDMQNFGLVVASDDCSLATVRTLAQSLERGVLSPLRFAGSSPSILAGLTAIQLQIRGPTICLTMPPENASLAFEALLAFWFENEGVSAAMAISHWSTDTGGHRLSGAIIRQNEEIPAAQLAIRPTGP